MKQNNKLFIDALNKGWNDFSFPLPNVPLTNPILSFFVSLFWKDIVPKLDGLSYGLMLKVKFTNGTTRSISSMQLLQKESFDQMEPVFLDFWNLRSDDYHTMPVSEVIFAYRLLRLDFPTKIVKAKNVLARKETPFIFRGYSLPTTMDLHSWGNVSFNPDYSSCMISTNKSISYSVTIDETKHIVHVFSSNRLLFKFTDYIYNTSDLSSFRRVINKQEVIFQNGVVVLKSVQRTCKFIKKLRPSQFRSTNFITMDLETRTLNNIMSIVCISYFDGTDYHSFYLKNYNSQIDMISAAFSGLCTRKYSGYRVYFHNLSKFDAVFLLKDLTTLYKIKPILRDGALIELNLNFGKGHLIIHDSLLLLPTSLEKLAKSFKVEQKGFFPYRFINNKRITLDYDGRVPDFYWFKKDVKLIDYNNYVNDIKINNSSWNLEREIIKYCELDVKVLHQVISKFSEEIFNAYRVDVIKHPTLPSLAFAIFRTRFMKNENIPILLGELYNDLYIGYTGGAVDVYKPQGKNVYSYDINSLFPTAMKSFPMPVGSPIYFEGDINSVNIPPSTMRGDKPFGFFYAKISAPLNLHKPVLQLRLKTTNGVQTVSPVGTWEGWYFSEELLNAVDNYGYKIQITKGYLFNKENIFKDYVETLYKIKEENSPGKPNADPCKCLISKFLLNMLYGRFGMSPDFKNHIILKSDEAEKYYSDYEVTDVMDFNNGLELLEFYPKEISDNNSGGCNVSVALSAAVTAYSRVLMCPFKHIKDNECLYTDTDCAHLLKPLAPEFVGSGLGKMKLEHVFSKSVYLAPKCYGGLYHPELSKDKIIKEGPQLVKVKGLKNPVSYYDLELLLFKDSKLEVEQTKWYRHFDQGYISLKKEMYTLKVTSNKRELIYDSYGKFIETRPFELKDGLIMKKEPTIVHYLPLTNNKSS